MMGRRCEAEACGQHANVLSDMFAISTRRPCHMRSQIGLGVLLEREPIPEERIMLNFARPDNGKHMLALTMPMATTVKAVKAEVAKATGLKASAMVMARGKMGSRISDSAANLFADDETLWSCGYFDGMTPGMMYMGEAEKELNDAAKAGTLVLNV